MKTQWNGGSSPVTSRSASNDSRWRPNALRSTDMSMSPRSRVFVFSAWFPASFESRMHPAQVPMIGIPSSPARRTISSKSPSFTSSFEIVVLSPPGIVRPSTRARSSGRRTAIASPCLPYSFIARATASTCSLTSPWTPMTPIRISGPTAASDKNHFDSDSRMANRGAVQLFSCSGSRRVRNSSCKTSANASESRSRRRWLATLLMTTSSPSWGDSRGRNTSSPSGKTASPIGDRRSASGCCSSSGTTSKNRSRKRGRRTRPRTVTLTRSIDGSSDVFVSSASRLMPTWNGSNSTDMPPNGVTYQCRNVSTGKVGAGLPGAPRLRGTDEKLPAPVFVISVSKIRLESTSRIRCLPLLDRARYPYLQHGCTQKTRGAFTAIGFVLIDIEPTREKEVYQKLTKIKDIVELYPLFGEYDLIAKVEADSYDAIGKLVVSKIRSIEGVKATKTLARVAF